MKNVKIRTDKQDKTKASTEETDRSHSLRILSCGRCGRNSVESGLVLPLSNSNIITFSRALRVAAEFFFLISSLLPLPLQ